MIKKTSNLAILSAVLMALITGGGGGALVSCTLEPSTEPPSEKIATHLEGLPFDIYEPQITFGSASSMVFTYKISKVDFSNWNVGSASVYTAQKDATSLERASPQSIEALILYYGTESIGLLKDDGKAIESVYAGSAGTLVTKASEDTASYSHYVIVPLDTERIKLELTDMVSAGSASVTPVVWIEENTAIGPIYSVNGLGNANDGGSLGAGTYVVKGYNIGGFTFDFDNGGSVSTANIGNFNSGSGSLSTSIATVLEEGRTSKITFYTGVIANSLKKKLGGDVIEAGSFTAGDVTDWLNESENKPALSVEYEWAD
jgi:hypothetical protein